MKRDLTMETGILSATLLIVMLIVVAAEKIVEIEIGTAHIISIVGLILSLVLKTGFEVLEKQNRVLIDQNKFMIEKIKKH